MAARTAMVLEEIKARCPAGACATLPPDYCERLRDSVCDYAAALRETGETPDQAVKCTRFLIARTMREIDLYPGCLMDVAVAWAVEEYRR